MADPTGKPGPTEAFIQLGVAVLAAVIAVRGTMSILPDFILRDDIGEVRGIAMMGLAIIGLFAAGCVIHWFEGNARAK